MAATRNKRCNTRPRFPGCHPRAEMEEDIMYRGCEKTDKKFRGANFNPSDGMSDRGTWKGIEPTGLEVPSQIRALYSRNNVSRMLRFWRFYYNYFVKKIHCEHLSRMKKHTNTYCTEFFLIFIKMFFLSKKTNIIKRKVIIESCIPVIFINTLLILFILFIGIDCPFVTVSNINIMFISYIKCVHVYVCVLESHTRFHWEKWELEAKFSLREMRLEVKLRITLIKGRIK